MRFGVRGRGVAAAAVAVALGVAVAGCTRGSGTPAPGAGGSVPASSSGTALPSASASASGGAPESVDPAAPSAGSSPRVAASSAAAGASGFDLHRYSVDDPRSIWVVVDKRRPLQPQTWVPPDLVQPDVPHTNAPQLRRAAAAALERMFAAARADGVHLVSLSAYRSYATQQSIFERNLVQLGRATTLQLTAKPGYSEHQTGLADDIGDGGSCDLQVCFESHPAAKWLLADSWRYGFVQRYPTGYTAITGIQVEPWHFRYVGVALATHLHETGVKTLEQAFGLPASPDYR